MGSWNNYGIIFYFIILYNLDFFSFYFIFLVVMYFYKCLGGEGGWGDCVISLKWVCVES